MVTMKAKEILCTNYEAKWLVHMSPSMMRRLRAVDRDWKNGSGRLPDYMSVGDKARQVVGYDHRLDWVAQQRGWPPGARRVLKREYTQ